MTITLTEADILLDIKIKSHQQAETIVDPTERYKVEAGTEKEDDIKQCIKDAAAEVCAVLRPFLTSYSSLSFTLDVTTRKETGLQGPLTDAIYAYIVDSAMAKFYRDVNRPTFAEQHLQHLPTDLAAIESLIYRRTKPTYTTPSD